MPYVTRRPLRIDRLAAAVAHPSSGGVATFVGIVRNHHEGRRVTRLEYTAYVPMAEREMAAVAREVLRRHPGVRLAMRHRLGSLRVGEAAVAVAAAAPHRAEAFAACRHAIDLVKAVVPIWKKEVGPRGTFWIEGARSVPSGRGTDSPQGARGARGRKRSHRKPAETAGGRRVPKR